MQSLDDITAQLNDWFQFFREMGIEEFYECAPEMPDKLPLNTSRTMQEGAVAKPARAAPGAGGSTTSTPQTLNSAPHAAPGGSRRFPQAPGLFDDRTTVVPPTGETLDQISQDLGDCHRCKLAAGRKHIVFGQGNSNAELVFVGEGPGADEDEQGLPFVGRAGQLLNRMLQLIAIKREDVYICNVVKCRPPGNRAPEADEVGACSPFLVRQIEAIHPRLVCCLGAPATKTVLGVKEGITKIHGRLFDYGSAKAIVTVHPAYVLRNPREEKILREDFEKIRAYLACG
ncbi:MAG: uracil-DNA glycosylase [Terriglobia bacterium]